MMRDDHRVIRAAMVHEGDVLFARGEWRKVESIENSTPEGGQITFHLEGADPVSCGAAAKVTIART